MKVVLLVGALLFSLVVVATPASAVASCTNLTNASCPGLYCSGNVNGHWQKCTYGPCDGPMVCRNPCDMLSTGCDPCRWFEGGCVPPCGATTCQPPQMRLFL